MRFPSFISVHFAGSREGDSEVVQEPSRFSRYSLPRDVAFCKKCVVSNQRPRISFDSEGVCSACRFQEYKKGIDWSARDSELSALLDRYRSKNGQHDVIVPCSGGKDGSFVAHQLKFVYGMNPLCVTWSPLIPTSHGRENLRRFVETGFDHVLETSDPVLAGRLSWWSLKEIGDPFQPFIYGQTNFPLRVSAERGIPLIMYGENGEVEYGGDMKNAHSPTRQITDHEKHYFSNVGPDYWESKGFTDANLQPYQAPSLERLKEVGTEIHFFGYYKFWDPQANFYYSAEHTGFRPNPERTQGTYSKYASLDDKVDGFHYYLSYLKFGIGRATSDAAHEIRDGHLSREEGQLLVRKFDAEFPTRYVEECLEYWGASRGELEEVLSNWTNPSLFEGVGADAVLRYQV